MQSAMEIGNVHFDPTISFISKLVVMIKIESWSIMITTQHKTKKKKRKIIIIILLFGKIAWSSQGHRVYKSIAIQILVL